MLEGEIARSSGDKPRKGERILDERAKRIALARKRRTKQGGRMGEGERKRELGGNQIESALKGGRSPMSEETGRKSANRELVPPWHFLRTSVRGAKR